MGTRGSSPPVWAAAADVCVEPPPMSVSIRRWCLRRVAADASVEPPRTPALSRRGRLHRVAADACAESPRMSASKPPLKLWMKPPTRW